MIGRVFQLTIFSRTYLGQVSKYYGQFGQSRVYPAVGVQKLRRFMAARVVDSQLTSQLHARHDKPNGRHLGKEVTLDVFHII